MEEMIAARYNLWWYLSLIFPAALMLSATFWHKKYILIIAIILSLLGTYTLCRISVHEKWKTRLEIAKTQEEIEYACTDGANLAFTAVIIGPFEAIVYTTFWSFIGWVLWPKILSRRKNET